MSRLRTAVSKLLALGGLTTLGGTSLALYRYSLLGENTAECRAPSSNFKNCETIVKERSSFEWDDDWDRRKPVLKVDSDQCQPVLAIVDKNGKVSEESVAKSPPPEIKTPTATRHVILVRHGQYHMVKQDDAKKLTDIGRQQAAVTGERLKSLNINFDTVTSSTMVRAQETANIIKNYIPENIPFSECSLLREGAPYPPEPSSKRWNPERWRFFQDNPRIEGAFRKYIHRASPSQKEDSYDLIVCHGNVIRYFVCRALQFPPEGWLRMSVGNCGVTWLTIRPNGRVSLRGLGDTGHLPPELVTFS